MLKKPFKLIDSVDKNNYYVFYDVLNQIPYIATESVIKYGRKFKKEFTQGLKIMPLQSFMLNVFLKVAQNNDFVEVEKAWGVEKEKEYAILDIRKIRSEFNSLLNKNKLGGGIVSYTEIPKNPTIVELMNEGYYPLAVEKLGIKENVYLLKTNKSGNLSVFTVLLGGRTQNDKKVLDINQNIFRRETIISALEEIQKTFKKNNKIKEIKEEIKND